MLVLVAVFDDTGARLFAPSCSSFALRSAGRIYRSNAQKPLLDSRFSANLAETLPWALRQACMKLVCRWR